MGPIAIWAWPCRTETGPIAAQQEAVPHCRLRMKGVSGQSGALSEESFRRRLVALDRRIFLGLSLALPAALLAQREGTPVLPAFPDADFVNRGAFREREFTVESGKYKLPGLLSVPRDRRGMPGVVIIGGGAARDRNGREGANRPWQDLAHGLASRGIAVLRYEPRELMYPDEFLRGWTIEEELLVDAEAAVKALAHVPGVNANRVCVLAVGKAAWATPELLRRLPPLRGAVLLNPLARFSPERRYADLMRLSEAGVGPDADQLRRHEPEPRMLAKRGFPNAERVLGYPAAYWYHLEDFKPAAEILESEARFFVAFGGLDYLAQESDRETWRQFLEQTERSAPRVYDDADHLMIQRLRLRTVWPSDLGKPGHVSGELVEDIAGFLR